MLDVDQQLARLRERVAKIDRKYLTPKAVNQTAPVRLAISTIPGGTVVENEFGSYLQLERSFAAHHQHGSADIGALSELPDTLLGTLSQQEIPSSAPARWAFLDTETTGLAGGSGTYAFLIGVGRITERGFTVRQYFLREYAEERSALAALEQHLSEFDVLITYNGRSYDQPLLETRYRMNRSVRRSAGWGTSICCMAHGVSGRCNWKAAASSSSSETCWDSSGKVMFRVN